MRISERVRRIEPSLTLAVTQRAMKLRAEGVDVVSFSAGEPDFDTPEHIKRAAIEALGRGASKYTQVAGIPELRRAVADELNRVHGTRHETDNVIVSSGAKHALYNLFMALLDPGDEVVIPSPCWVSYPELVSMAGGKPVILETRSEDGFRIDPHVLAERVHKSTRAVLISSPCNPTGAMYDAATLEVVARVIRERGGPETYVITDDIYRMLVYRGTWHSFIRVAPDLAARTLLVDGVSKSYAMTGWRIGYCAGPRDLIEAMTTLQGQSTTNCTAVAQAAALAAITGPQECVETMRQEFDRRRQVMVARLRALPGVRLHEPEGAFYAFPDVRAYLAGLGGRLGDDLQLADWLLDRARVAVVPGSGFLAPGHLRLSYATSMRNVEEGLERIARAFGELGNELSGELGGRRS
jgi:aspartate aminotransferase